MTLETVGVVGWGRMGRQMGRRLLAASYPVSAFDVASSALEHARDDGAALADSPFSLAQAVDVVITMLPDPRAVTRAAEGPDGLLAGLRRGALWLEMTSSHPDTTGWLARAVRDAGAHLLDAPVSGGVPGAAEGTLTIMVGGPKDVAERARPLLAHLGSHVIHVGDRPGDGDLAKTINNLLSAINLTSAAEGLALGIRAGLEPARLIECITTGTGASHAITTKIPRYVLTGSLDSGFTVAQYLKDLRIALDLAATRRVPAVITALTHQVWTRFAATGHADDDHTAVVPLVAADAGITGEGKQ